MTKTPLRRAPLTSKIKKCLLGTLVPTASSGQQQTQFQEKSGEKEGHTPSHAPSLGAGENPEVLSRTWVPAGSRPLACALASSMACLLFSTSLSRCVRSTYGSQNPKKFRTRCF